MITQIKINYIIIANLKVKFFKKYIIIKIKSALIILYLRNYNIY